MDTVYILTSAYNMYDQMGEYFIAWFKDKPSKQQIKAVIADTEDGWSLTDGELDHILSGGGRSKRMEDQWFYLKEVRSSN